ncbi:hypothetical protein N7513_001978 [Penicillium frequentans]|nr:hypothetical protein N7513_001978 [Penicillium glabrum]
MSTAMKCVWSVSGVSHTKRSFMQGLCDDLRGKAILEMDQMIEILMSATIDPHPKTRKRTREETDFDRGLISSKTLEARYPDEQYMLDTAFDTATHAQLAGPSVPPECVEMQPALDEDFFAPLLFHSQPQQYADHFDPPFFLETSNTYHCAQPELHSIRMRDDITGPIFPSAPQMRGSLTNVTHIMQLV